MAFRICEDVGTTARKKMTPRRALKLWERHSGVCVLCHQPIDGAREDWFIEHLIALENGGSDDDESGNLGPAHLWHKASKDAVDHSTGAQAKRRKRRHIGIKTRKGPPMIGSRDSGWKRRMDGTLVRRAK
jgi:5-methylcytosine-specific restriction protein A